MDVYDDEITEGLEVEYTSNVVVFEDATTATVTDTITITSIMTTTA